MIIQESFDNKIRKQKIDFYSIKDRDIDFAKKALTNLQNEFENEIAECQL